MKKLKTALIISVLALTSIASAKVMLQSLETSQIVHYTTPLRTTIDVMKFEDGDKVCYISYSELNGTNIGVNQSISCLKK